MNGFDPNCSECHRRRFLQMAMAGAATLFTVPGAFADVLAKTPRMTEGPFYPDKYPLDTDNDLVLLNDKLTPAVGTITHLTGKVVDANGKPMKNVVVEIWQVDNNAVYLHKNGGDREKMDKNFQGFGRFNTASNGEYYFRTIKPVPYPGRTPHIHVAVNKNGKRLLTTQFFIKGEKQNDTDGIIRNIRDPKQRENVIIDFKPMKDSKIGEQEAHFEIVVGDTPEGDSRRRTAYERKSGSRILTPTLA